MLEPSFHIFLGQKGYRSTRDWLRAANVPFDSWYQARCGQRGLRKVYVERLAKAAKCTPEKVYELLRGDAK